MRNEDIDFTEKSKWGNIDAWIGVALVLVVGFYCIRDFLHSMGWLNLE